MSLHAFYSIKGTICALKLIIMSHYQLLHVYVLKLLH